MTLKQLRVDKENLLRELEEAQKLAVLSNPSVNKLQGALNYVNACIQRLEKK